MLVAITARWNVVLSPTLTGIVGNCGATPPASNMMTRFGACVRCASIDAAHGSPVPTATVLPSSSSRAAQQIISSIALNDIRGSQSAATRQDKRIPADGGARQLYSVLIGARTQPIAFRP